MADPTSSKTHRIPPVPESSLEAVPDSALGAMFAAARPAVGTGWQPPVPEELQLYFSQYEICGVLGRGGMGAVNKGLQKSLHRIVAIKVLPAGIEDDGMKYPERCKQEARAMAKFRHEGVVATHDAGETRDAFAEPPLKQIIAKAEHTPKGYRLPSGNHLRISPESQHSGAEQIRVTSEGEKFASIFVADDDNTLERVRYLGRNSEWQLTTGMKGGDEPTVAAKRTASPSDRQPHELLSALNGGRLRVAMDGQLLHDEADPSAVSGSFVLDICSDANVCVDKAEYTDLDGVPEHETLEFLGIRGK